MSNYTQKTESEKPWLDAIEGLHKTFYPLSWNKPNSYAIFSPGVDRFIVVDNYDPWMLYETGKVLSSKVSNMVYVLDQVTPDMNNETCLNFSTLHKKNEKSYGFEKVRKTPSNDARRTEGYDALKLWSATSITKYR
jgi:hypothetical protein